MSPYCWAVRTRLPSLDGDRPFEGRLGEHAASCLRCQAEMARYRSLRRHLGGLAQVVIIAPPTVLAAVEARLGDVPQPLASSGHRAAIVAAAAAGAAVAAAGTIVVLGLRRARSAA